jgi:hypothetical protein
MAFYKSGVERMIQAARARRIECGASCVPRKPNKPRGHGNGRGTAGLYTSWLNDQGGQGATGGSGGNTPTGNESSGNGSGGKKNGVNYWACTANVGSAGNSCQRAVNGRYATEAACISATECSE